VAFGSDAMMYWLWRTHHSGQELGHGAVVTTWGRPSHIFGEVRQVAAEFEKAQTFLTETKPVPNGLAMHFSMDAARTAENQLLSVDLKGYNHRITSTYIAFREAQMDPEVLDPAHDLFGHKVIMSPYLTCIEHKGLRDRLKAWIEAGGIWIAGPYTDVRNKWDGLYKEAPFGVLEDWADIRCDYTMPHGEDIPVHFTDGRTVSGSVVFDALVCGPTAKSLASYQEEGFLKAYSAVTVTPMGKGKIVVLGTILPTDILVELVTNLGIAPSVNADANVAVVPRAGDTRRGWICVEMKNRVGKIQVPADCVDLLTGSSYKKDQWVEMLPYGVLVLEA
jgi:beta-galactosidase